MKCQEKQSLRPTRGNKMISRIFSYIGKFIVNPTKAAKEIAEDKLGLWAGFGG
jgi:hypothetical protein